MIKIFKMYRDIWCKQKLNFLILGQPFLEKLYRKRKKFQFLNIWEGVFLTSKGTVVTSPFQLRHCMIHQWISSIKCILIFFQIYIEKKSFESTPPFLRTFMINHIEFKLSTIFLAYTHLSMLNSSQLLLKSHSSPNAPIYTLSNHPQHPYKTHPRHYPTLISHPHVIARHIHYPYIPRDPAIIEAINRNLI